MPTPRTVVILGASANPARYSNMLMRRLRHNPGYKTALVNPGQDEIDGEAVHASLSAAPQNPAILTLYVSPSRSAALESDIVRLKPAKVIFNPGAENPPLEAALNRAGIATENACSLVLLSQNAL